MENKIVVLGVHRAKATEPVHLIEIELTGSLKVFDFGDVTQENTDLPNEKWQVAYDERELEMRENTSRYTFFFHYLDLKKPLVTPFGSAELPKVTPMPPHLSHIKYEEP